MDAMTQSLSPSPQQWLILALLGVIGLAMLAITRRSRPRDGSKDQSRRQEGADNRETARVRDDMERLLTELDVLSSKMNQQLDEAHGRLQDAIKDADQRVFALRTLVQAAQSPPARPPGQAPASNPAPSSLSAAGGSARGGKPQVSSLQSQASSLEPLDPRTRRIYELADQGLAAHEIAQRLEDHVGEVELILHLRAMAQRPVL